MTTTVYDAIVIGGGPAGATAAMVLSRAGRSVLLVEKERFPRFHVGESLLPAIMPLFEALGISDIFDSLTRFEKRGAAFSMGDAETLKRIRFADSLTPTCPATFNIERAVFDRAILEAAERAGVEVRQGVGVDQVLHLADGDVRVRVDGEELHARYLVDASGQSTVLGRHLNTRRLHDDPSLRKVAYFGHFEGVDRAHEMDDGDIVVILCEEAWFWMIPIDETRTSIGMVMDADASRRVPGPANQKLFWGIERCPAIAKRMRHAAYPPSHNVTSDFSYTCEPYAGPGFFLIGDAATFLDPIFSTGIYLGMEDAMLAGQLINDLLAGRVETGTARDQYIRFVRSGAKAFEKMIRAFYRESFRDLFLSGEGPLKMHRAVVSVLAGNVYPRVAWPVRWRLGLFNLLTRVQSFVPITPRQGRFSLLESAPRTEKPAESPVRVAAEM